MTLGELVAKNVLFEALPLQLSADTAGAEVGAGPVVAPDVTGGLTEGAWVAVGGLLATGDADATAGVGVIAMLVAALLGPALSHAATSAARTRIRPARSVATPGA